MRRCHHSPFTALESGINAITQFGLRDDILGGVNLFELSYTSEAWATQVGNPQNVLDRAKPLIEGLGGTIESFYYAFGDYDIIGVADLPDNVSAAALSLAVSAGGAVKSIRTTPLMTIEDGIAAMKAANSATYNPPSAG